MTLKTQTRVDGLEDRLKTVVSLASLMEGRTKGVGMVHWKWKFAVISNYFLLKCLEEENLASLEDKVAEQIKIISQQRDKINEIGETSTIKVH